MYKNPPDKNLGILLQHLFAGNDALHSRGDQQHKATLAGRHRDLNFTKHEKGLQQLVENSTTWDTIPYQIERCCRCFCLITKFLAMGHVTNKYQYTLRIQVCPKVSGFPLQSYDLGLGFRPSILLIRDGYGFLG